MSVSNIQLEIINKAENYIQKNSNNNINVDSSGNCFLCAWGITPGFAILKLWQDGSGGCLIESKDKCLIKKSNHSTLIVILNESLSYYRTITQKLHWASSLNKNFK